MSNGNNVALLQTMTDETDEAVLNAYLELASSRIVRKCYPFGDGTELMPDKYRSIQLEVAAYMINKRGAEGEKAHSENGISRTYEDGDIPASLLRTVIPEAKVVG